MKIQKKKEGTAKKKRKISPLMLFAFLLIFFGLSVLVYPIIGDFVANQSRSAATANYNNAIEKLSKSTLNEQFKQAEEYNENIFAQQQGKVPPYPKVNYDKIANQAGVMGTLDIPAINIKDMPFYHGTDELTLNKGLGHFKPSSIPIGGKDTRAVIAGHSGLENQVLFTNVSNLQIGDIFYINILGKKLAYQIQSEDEVLPSDVDKVKIQSGQDMVTLVTCTPPGINTYRLLINGVRIPYDQAIAKKVTNRDMFSYTNVVIGSIVAAILLFLLLLFIYRYLKKKYDEALDTEDETLIDKAKRRLLRLFVVIKTLFVLLIVLIVTILGLAIYGYTQISHQNQMGSINIGRNQQLANYNLDKSNKANYTEKDIASVTTGTYTTAKLDFNQSVNDWGIGKLVVPSQKINLPILAGLNNENLMNGASTYSNQDQIGHGNYVLLAHNVIGQSGKPLDVLFWRLVNLKKGDLVYASDFKNVYIYKVTTNEVIPDTQVSVLEQPTDPLTTPIITMIRCEGGIGTPWRRVVQGNLFKTESIAEMNKEQVGNLGFVQNGQVSSGQIYGNQTFSFLLSLAMQIAAAIVSDPLQTVIPISLLLVVPILLLNIINNPVNKKKKS